nr:MAG TPA: hypothetical protein [Caudoviricetes sp.]
MISYEDNRNCVSCATPAGLQESMRTLSGMMDQANGMAQRVLTMAYAINSHMFGGVTTPTEGEAAPLGCFRDVLDNQVETLDKAVRELESTMVELGVQMDA